MKELMERAGEHLEQACKGQEDFCSIRYWMGYMQALRDVAEKLKKQSLDLLED